MTPERDGSVEIGAAEGIYPGLPLLRASADSMLDPQVILEARTDSSGQIVDLIYAEVNRATSDYLGLSREELLGRGVLEVMPGFKGTLFLSYLRCLNTGEPLILDDFTYDHEILLDSRRYDIRATRATSTSLVLTWRDVTDRFHTAQRIAESEAILRARVDSMIDPQVLIEAVRDPDRRVVDFRYLSANEAACTYLGLAESELVGQTQLENSPILKDSELQRRYAQCLEDGEPVILDDFSFFNEILDDARRYDIRATRAGADLLSLTWSDCTHRFLDSQHLEESERNYRLLAENSGDVVSIMRGGKFDWISPSAERVLGAPPDYWIGREVREIIPPGYEMAHAERLKRLLTEGSIQERSRVQSVDGRLIWIQLNLKTFDSSDGDQEGYTAAFRVIDGEVAAEMAAEDARKQQAKADARYRRSIDNAAVGMYTTDPQGRFTDINDAMCQYFGYDATTMIQMTWQELTAPEYLETDVVNVDKIMAGEIDSYRRTKQFIHADGSPLWGDLSVGCLREPDGEVEWFIGQLTDITEEVRARDQLALIDEENRLLAERLGKQSQRLANDLGSAAKYMASIMPRGLTGTVEVVSRYLPSQEIGGDCFYYNWIDDDHLRVYLIDVSGHGLEPALLSVSVHNMIRSGSLRAETLLAPEALLTELNSLFQMEQQGDHYFTMWCGVYEASTRTLRYSSAGSPPPFALCFADGRAISVDELSLPSTPIGMFEGSEYSARTYSVPIGCQIVVYSDGASEINLPDGKQLSALDFKKLLSGVASSPGWSLDGLIDELTALSPAGVFEDDFSLIRMDMG